MSSYFQGSLNYTGVDAMDFIVIVNPKNVSPKQGTIYEDLFPVAWKVLSFPAQMGGTISFTYDPQLTALVMPEIINNRITAKEGQPIGESNFFDVINSGNAFAIMPDKSRHSKATATIANKADRILPVGLGDVNQTAYMTLEVHPSWDRELLLFSEFAVIPVNGYVENQQFVSDQSGPWLWINGKAIGATLTIKHDGNKFTVTDVPADDWKQFSADVSPFKDDSKEI
ncbi:hypothetical protein EC968_002990 [Mortierella alpina]|nr:hypothetical protein EC968_002990 [Mortierella alpina]